MGDDPNEKSQNERSPLVVPRLGENRAKSTITIVETEDYDWETQGDETFRSNFLRGFKKTRKKFTKESIKERVFHYIPVTNWIRDYKLEYLRGDVIAGITVAVMVIPQTLAFSGLMNVKPIVALQSAFFPLLVYFFFGNSRQLAIGPSAVTATLTNAALDQIMGSKSVAPTSPEEFEQWVDLRTEWCCFITMIVGLFTLLLGLVRFGFLIHMFSRALLSGFLNAVAIHILSLQAGKLFGISTDHHSPKVFIEIIEKSRLWNFPSMMIGFGCFFFLLMMRFLKKSKSKYLTWVKFFPEILFVVLIPTILCATMDLVGVKTLGKNSVGFTAPRFPSHWMDFGEVVPSAFAITVVGMVESVLTANTYASKMNYRVSNNRELVAIGLANLVSSIFQSFPAFASLSRSSINFMSGAKTAVSSLVTSLGVLLSILVLLPHLSTLPSPAMAAVIVNAAIGIFELHEMVFLWHMRAYVDLCLFFFSFFLTLFFGMELGIAVITAVSLFLIVKHTSSPHITIMKQSDEDKNNFETVAVLRDISLFVEKHNYMFKTDKDKGVLIVKIDEALYFANMGQVRELMNKLEQRAQLEIHDVVFDAANIPFVDPSAAHTFFEMITEWKKKGIEVCFVRAQPSVVRSMISSGILDLISPERMFGTIHDAMDYLESRRADHISRSPV